MTNSRNSVTSSEHRDSEIIWQEACAAALVGLPFMGPARLRALLFDMTPDVAWTTVAGAEPITDSLRRLLGSRWRDITTAWKHAAASVEPLHLLDRYRQLGIEVWTPFTRYPARLVEDEYAPVVLFAQGNKQALDRTTVGIIGTRRCTHEGRANARMFGRELAEAGIAVMSGLALGIDGAAHIGSMQAAFGAPPIAIVGNGLDSVYPKRHAELWAQVQRVRADHFGISTGCKARTMALSRSQPNSCRLVRRIVGGGIARTRRLIDHRARGARSKQN